MWVDEYPHDVFASALLCDGELLSWRVGNPAKERPEDFYKDFYYGGRRMKDFDKLSVEVKAYPCLSDLDHSEAFKSAEDWLAQFKPHEMHLGSVPQTIEEQNACKFV